MKRLSSIPQWGDRHHPAILDALRVLLGLFLLLKGVAFLNHQAYLSWILEREARLSLSPQSIRFMIGYVTYVHLAGGALILLGLITRVASLLQLPIVIGAIFFINIFKSPVNSDLWLSVFAAVLLIIFSVLGSGPLSLDYFLRKLQDQAS